MENKEWNYGIDIMKILSAFMIVFYHFGHREYEFYNAAKYIPNINYIAQTLVAFSIPLFFMVNGALVLNKIYSKKSIYFKIFKLAFIILFYNFIKFPDWFLKTLIILYLIYPILKKILDKFPRLLILIIGIFIIFPDLYNFVISILKFFMINSFNVLEKNIEIKIFPRTGFFTMYSIPLFLLGGIFLRKNVKIKKYQGILLVLIGLSECLFEAISITRYSKNLFDSGNGNFPTIGALLMATGIFLMLNNINIEKRFEKVISFLGRNVFSVYLFHMALIRIINLFILKKVLPLYINIIISTGIYLLATIIGEIISKIPYLRETIKI